MTTRPRSRARRKTAPTSDHARAILRLLAEGGVRETRDLIDRFGAERAQAWNAIRALRRLGWIEETGFARWRLASSGDPLVH